MLTVVTGSSPEDVKCGLHALADAKAHATEVSSVTFFALPSPSLASSPLALISASALREGGGGGTVKVFTIPASNEGGTGGLVCVRVFTGISSPPAKLLVTICATLCVCMTRDILLQSLESFGWVVSGGSDGYLR